MAVPVVDPPVSRPAGSLGLVGEDFEALKEFQAHRGAGSWFERDAHKVFRRAIRFYREGRLNERDRLILFERDGDLQAVTLLTEDRNDTAELAYVGIDADLHGARIDSPTGDRLSDAVVESTLDYAEDLGFRQVMAQVARDHRKSLALLGRVGFEFLSRFDHDYDFYAISLG